MIGLTEYTCMFVLPNKTLKNHDARFILKALKTLVLDFEDK